MSRFAGTVSRNAARQLRNQFGYLRLPKGVAVFEEEPGSRVSLDFIPYKITSAKHPDRDDEYGVAMPGGYWYKRPFFLHRNVGADNQTVVCPTSNGDKCPICEYRAKLLKEGADWNDESVRALKPSRRNLYVVVPKGNRKYDEVPHIWDISQHCFQDALNEELSENETYETFPDPQEGYTLQIRFSEETYRTNKFAKTSRIDFVERAKQYKDSIMDEVPSLDEVLDVPSYKTLEALFFGGLSASEVDEWTFDDEDETSPPKVAKPAKADDEDDDPPKPAPKMSRTAKDPAKSRCPHGHEFGTDCDEYDDCDKCAVWDACQSA